MAVTYFNWLVSIISDDDHPQASTHRKLLEYLNKVDFYWSVSFDENRAADGMELRNEFPYGRRNRAVMTRGCTVLEMIIALALRCERDIMSDPELGDRTPEWFWMMIDNLGLSYMTDDHFNMIEASKIIRRLLNREYSSNGEGSLFPMQDPWDDMRMVDIWNQLNWYLEERCFS